MDPAPLLKNYASLLSAPDPEGPVLDLACGDGHNGLYLAGLGVPVILADRSLDKAKTAAEGKNLPVTFWEIDLETGLNPFPENHYRGIVVFRYLHRPLIPFLKFGIQPGGILIYETFTREQAQFGRPHNPDFLLNPGELTAWFPGWETIHYFEGILQNPARALARLVCRKPR